MNNNLLIGLYVIFILIFIVSVVSVILNYKRLHKNSRSAVLNALKCKKEEIRSKILHITYLIGLSKDKKIDRNVCIDIIENEYEELIKVHKEYMDIKKQLTTEELKHEKERYDKSIEGVSSLIATLKTIPGK